FAELTPAEKNKVSHRGRAIKKLSEKFDDWWVKE
ncbi:ribonuclease PH/Ham1 protein, partial [Liquorilactobacillus mali KCTC 3596 = DSM 20444]